VISSTFTLFEKNLHALSHIDSQETIQVADHGSDDSKSDSLSDAVLTEVLSPERSDLQIELDDESTV
jgi:hypothetical protein